MYVTYVQMCPPLTCVLSIPHCFCESLCLSVYHHSLWHVLHSPNLKPLVKALTEQGKYFYQALLYIVRVYFLPSYES